MKFTKARAKHPARARGHRNDITAKKFLVRLSTTPQAPLAQRMEIRSAPKTLRWHTRILHHLAQFHVVEHVETQRLICAQSFVHRPPNHVECPYADVIFGLWVGNLPGTMSEDEQGLEKSDHHFFPRVLHDHAGKETRDDRRVRYWRKPGRGEERRA